jgi:hypothetical protein
VRGSPHRNPHPLIDLIGIIKGGVGEALQKSPPFDRSDRNAICSLRSAARDLLIFFDSKYIRAYIRLYIW